MGSGCQCLERLWEGGGAVVNSATFLLFFEICYNF